MQRFSLKRYNGKSIKLKFGIRDVWSIDISNGYNVTVQRIVQPGRNEESSRIEKLVRCRRDVMQKYIVHLNKLYL